MTEPGPGKGLQRFVEKRYLEEIARRRTFGIISHPDAGKTTLTEKLLLFGGAIQLAGAVKSKKASRHATSDWMAMEKERGISVNTSVMNFHYRNNEINLLDTPGHQDFSEDTYRVLTAVDSALMVIDSAKGVETQTRKLMEVCRMRNTPIMTFINKLDREGLEPLELFSDIEETLQIECVPLTWPVGMGKRFRGIYHLLRNEMHFFTSHIKDRVQQGTVIQGLDNPQLDEYLGGQADELRESVELLQEASNLFDLKEYLKGNQTPVFFGSAINNFGVKELLDTFVELAPGPLPRMTESREVQPAEPAFSGFVFKIQANMDPAHRDRIAFLRVCSGRFTRGMKVRHHRLGKEVQFSNAMIFMAQDRKNVEEAFPGDIIGIPNHGTIRIGDTFSDKEPLKFVGIPSFAPEHFRRVRLKDPLKTKQMDKGLQQLTEEGAVQLFRPLKSNEYILGAVGVLQFDVIIERLKAEYNVDAAYEAVSYAACRWVDGDDRKELDNFIKKEAINLAYDAEKSLAYLAPSEWRLNHVREQWPAIRFHKTRGI